MYEDVGNASAQSYFLRLSLALYVFVSNFLLEVTDEIASNVRTTENLKLKIKCGTIEANRLKFQ